MGLSLVSHPETRALESALEQRLAALRGDDPLAAVWIVTPTHRLRRQLQRRLAAQPGGARLGLRFLDLRLLALAWEERLGLTPARRLTPLLARMHVRAALAETDAGQRLLRFRGAAAALEPAFFRLREAGLEAPEPARTDPDGARLALQTFRLWRERVRDAGLADDVDAVDRVSAALETAEPATAPPLLCFGFQEMVARHRRLLRALARRGEVDLFLFAAGADDEPELAASEALAAAFRESQAAPRERLSAAPRTAPRLRADSHRGTAGELEAAFSEVRARYLEGAPLEEQALVVRTLTPYAPHLGPVAERFGLDGLLDSPAGLPLHLQPAAQRLLQGARRAPDRRDPPAWLLELPDDGGSRELLEAWRAAAEAAEAFPDSDRLQNLQEALEIGQLRPWERHGASGLAVLDFQQARGMRYAHVVLAGLHQGSVPRPVREDPFLPDATLARLSEDLADPLPSIESQHDDEHGLLNLALRTAETELLLLRQHAEEEGVAAAASPLEPEVEEFFGRPLGFERRTSEPLARAEESVHGAAASEEDAALALARTPDGIANALELARRSPELAEFIGPGLEWTRAVERYEPADLSFDGDAGGPDDAFLESLTVTGLEGYGRSPLGFFFERLLGVEPRRPSGWPGPDALAIGIAVHAVLEAAYRAADSKGRTTGAERAFAERMAPLFRSEREGLAPYLEHECERWRRAILAFLDWDDLRLRAGSKDRTLGGPPMEAPAAWLEMEVDGALDLGGGRTLRMKGTVDRLLAGEEGLRVSDYKTGSVKDVSTARAFLRGERLQNALYLMLLEQQTEFANRPFGAEAVRVSPDCDYAATAAAGKYGSAMPAWLWEASRAGVRETVEVLVGQLRRGHFPALDEAWDNWFATMRIGHAPSRARTEAYGPWAELFLLAKKDAGKKSDPEKGLYLLEEVREALAP